MDDKKKFMPVKEYAEKQNVSLSYIYKLIRKGKIEHRKIGTYTLVRA